MSDLPKGEFLVPLAVVEKTSQRQLLRFETQTQEQAIAELEGAEAARLVMKLYEGARQHAKAGKLWQGWRAK